MEKIDYRLLFKIRKCGDSYLAILQKYVFNTSELIGLNGKEYFTIDHRHEKDSYRKYSGKIYEFPENIIPVGINYNINHFGIPKIFNFLYKSQLR